MDKETSSRVSSIAAHILKLEPFQPTSDVDAEDYNILLDQAKTLAGSALSQDETPGQTTAPGNFIDRLKNEHDELTTRVNALKYFLIHNHGGPSLTQRALLDVQLLTMGIYQRILKMRLDDLDDEPARSKPPVASERAIGEPVEIGGHDQDRDGPVPFDG